MCDNKKKKFTKFKIRVKCNFQNTYKNYIVQISVTNTFELQKFKYAKNVQNFRVNYKIIICVKFTKFSCRLQIIQIINFELKLLKI